MVLLVWLCGARTFVSGFVISYAMWFIIDWYDCFFLDWVLFTGCSHNGIVNILDKYYENDKNHRIDMVIGGFHLFNPVSKKYESDVLINEIAKELSKQECMFYTCHCTGPKAYQKLKSVMNDKLEYLSTGTVLEIN